MSSSSPVCARIIIRLLQTNFKASFLFPPAFCSDRKERERENNRCSESPVWCAPYITTISEFQMRKCVYLFTFTYLTYLHSTYIYKYVCIIMGQSQTKPQSILSYFDIYDYGGKEWEKGWNIFHYIYIGLVLYDCFFFLFIVRIWVEVLN